MLPTLQDFILVAIILTSFQVATFDVGLSHDGPVVSGGTITFKAELIKSDLHELDGHTFMYKWEDDAIHQHTHETETTSNTTNYFTVTYEPKRYPVGKYTMQVTVCRWFFKIMCIDDASSRIKFRITPNLNGDLRIEQSNKTVQNDFVASHTNTSLTVALRKGDFDYINKTATSITTYWFIDCKPYNTSYDFSINFNFTNTNYTHTIEALVVASYEQPITTTVAPTTTSTTTTPSTTTSTTTSTTSTTTTTPSTTTTTTKKPTTTSTTAHSIIPKNHAGLEIDQLLPYVCNPPDTRPQPLPDQNKTYGFFRKEIKVRDPIVHVNVTGTNWIQPWDMLSLTVSCNGSAPFRKCYQIQMGNYNVTGNETCKSYDEISTCNYGIEHWFLDPIDYTIVIILSNEVTTYVTPVKITFYKATPKPQLSVIVVPVSCSLVAIVVIIFGVAYYLQSRSRYTIEVADFDFGQGYKHLNNAKEST